MLLCDIGNSSYHFKDENKSYKESVETFNPQTIKEKVYFISVNVKVNAIIKHLDNWFNLSSFIEMKNYYDTMGIDRIVACEAVKSGVIVDVGSAITVDVIKNGLFQGGLIYPGIKAMSKTYEDISTTLKYDFNFDLDLDKLPKNSQDAISYGYLKPIYIEVLSHDLPIIITGGDAKIFKKIFKNAKVDEELIFKGMKKITHKTLSNI